MQEDKTPKVFISYSWSSDELVLDLAQRLVNHGVDVVLDMSQFLGNVYACHVFTHSKVRYFCRECCVQLVIVFQHLLLSE